MSHFRLYSASIGPGGRGEAHSKIDADLKAFSESGGQITQIPQGVGSGTRDDKASSRAKGGKLGKRSRQGEKLRRESFRVRQAKLADRD
jgi:hypothetical protein